MLAIDYKQNLHPSSGEGGVGDVMAAGHIQLATCGIWWMFLEERHGAALRGGAHITHRYT